MGKPTKFSAHPCHPPPHPHDLSCAAAMQHRRSRQAKLFTHALSYLGPADFYHLPLFALRLPLLHSFDEPIVPQVALVYDLIQIMAMSLREPIQHKTTITADRLCPALSPVRQYLVYQNPALGLAMQVCSMTAPGVVGGIIHYLASHRIEMEISDQL